MASRRRSRRSRSRRKRRSRSRSRSRRRKRRSRSRRRTNTRKRADAGYLWLSMPKYSAKELRELAEMTKRIEEQRKRINKTSGLYEYRRYMEAEKPVGLPKDSRAPTYRLNLPGFNPVLDVPFYRPGYDEVPVEFVVGASDKPRA